MAKKQANWITIPEETLHTPVSKTSGKKKEGAPGSVRNKLFWGIGFVVMIIAVFAVMAPTQFNELIKGSLFDAEGVGSPIDSPTDLLSPGNENEAVEVEEEVAEAEEVVSEEAAEEDYVSEPVVQPEEEAVSIVIEPIAEPEPVEVEPADSAEPSVDPEGAAEEVVEETPADTQAQLIEELNKQLEELQKQREEDVKTMEELAKAAEEEMKPAALEETTTGVPSSVVTTTEIGQPSAVQPDFRVNTHTVAITPQEMLSQNMAGGYQVAQQAVITPVYQPAYQVSTPSAVQTPDTGPSQVMFIAFLLTFVSLLGWKLIRLSLA